MPLPSSTLRSDYVTLVFHSIRVFLLQKLQLQFHCVIHLVYKYVRFQLPDHLTGHDNPDKLLLLLHQIHYMLFSALSTIMSQNATISFKSELFFNAGKMFLICNSSTSYNSYFNFTHNRFSFSFSLFACFWLYLTVLYALVPYLNKPEAPLYLML